MADTDTSSAPLEFTASFPCDSRFRPAMADLSAKVARSLGYSDSDARDIGQAIERAFDEAAESASGHGEVQFIVSLRPEGEAVDATVRCPHRVLLQLTRPRSH